MKTKNGEELKDAIREHQLRNEPPAHERTQHTPTPIYKEEIISIYAAIGQAFDEWPLVNKRAQEIVLAVNSYDKLKRDNEVLVEACKRARELSPASSEDKWAYALVAIIEAIAQAEKESL